MQIEQSFERIVSHCAAGSLSLIDLVAACEQFTQSERSDLAELAYRTWIACNQGHALTFAARFNRGVLLETRGDLQAAETEYRAALAAAPTLTGAALRLATLCARQGRSREAAAVLVAGLDRLVAKAALAVQEGSATSSGGATALEPLATALTSVERAVAGLETTARGTQSEPRESQAAAERHPLLQLQDLYTAASERLCSSLGGSDPTTTQHLLDAANAIPKPPGLAGEYEDWWTHFTLACAAIDLRTIAPPAETPQELPTTWRQGRGNAFSAAEVIAESARRGAEAIFFVAADLRYVGLYGSLFVRSVLDKADVESLVVVHVIGGAAQLADVAREIGIDDERLFFTGDAFDAEQPWSVCYDTPPKGRLAHPAAQYQSVRFQTLGALLRAFKLPVFVCDIDLILQYGVADLLVKHAGADLVVNENRENTSAGSRYTANLLLAFPTRLGLRFAARLRAYLDDHLSRPAVSRWIDQFALTICMNELYREAPEVNVGYFDTDRDINNIMYRTFTPNPFRFFSLFHGFDIDSLNPRTGQVMTGS